MKRSHLIKTVLLCLMVFGTQTSSAHGLHMTTVSVTQRQGDHLSFTIHTSLTDLFNRMEYKGKPGSVIYLANGSDEEIVQFRRQILTLLQQKMQLAVTQQPLQSVEVRTVESKALRELLLRDVAEHVLQAGVATDPNGNPRSDYLRIDIDGFIPKGEGAQVLEVSFPKELGQILISYSKPQMQTINPGEQGSHYVQPLQ